MEAIKVSVVVPVYNVDEFLFSGNIFLELVHTF